MSETVLPVERYRPVGDVVDAIQVTDENLEFVALWCGGIVVQRTWASGGIKAFVKVPAPHPTTTDNWFAVHPGEWLMRRVDGSFTYLSDYGFRTQYIKATADEGA